jgi:hypothetical protein
MDAQVILIWYTMCVGIYLWSMGVEAKRREETWEAAQDLNEEKCLDCKNKHYIQEFPKEIRP